MSSAFDALMSGAHAAAAKRKPQPQPNPSSPNKRKTLDSNPPQNPEITKLPNENVNKRLNLFGPERVKPSKSKMLKLKNKSWDFDPRLVACWGEGEPVPFMFLCLGFDMFLKESGLIVKTDILCNVLRTVMDTTADDVLPIVYLLANRIALAHEGLELGIGEASIINVLAEAYGRTKVGLRKLYNQLGDWGLVAKACHSSQSMMSKPNALTVTKVFNTFHLIAKELGKDSQEKKKNHIKGLLVAASNCEPLYLIRLLQENLRIGLAEQTLLAALGQAAVYAHSTPPPNIQSPLEEAVKIVKQAYSVFPVYDKIVTALLSGGVWNLQKTCSFTLGVPVGPMLAKPTNAVLEIVPKFQDTEFTCEYKYDGERAEVKEVIC